MSFARELEAASAEWVAEGLIEEELRHRILLRHLGVPSRSRAVPIIAAIGGLTLMAGMILLVASNWQEIPRPGKLGGAMATMAAVFAAGYWVRYGLVWEHTGEAIMLAGSGAFLGNLALVSQQYHVMTDPSVILFVFAASMVPLLYMLRSRIYALFTPVAFFAWMVALAANRDYADGPMAPMLLFAGVGAAIAAVGAAHRLGRLRSLAAPMELVGGLLLLFVLFWLGFYRHSVPDFAVDRWGAALFLAPPTVAIPVLAVVAMLRISPPRIGYTVVAAAAVVVVTLLWCVVVVLNPPDRPDGFTGNTDSTVAALYSGGFWLAYCALAGCLGWLGVVTGRDWWLNVALVAIGVFLITRYFDLFAEAEQRGLVFVGGGLLLLVVAAVLERSRRFIAGVQEVGA